MSFVNKKWTEPINYNFKLKVDITILHPYSSSHCYVDKKIQGFYVSVCISSKIYMCVRRCIDRKKREKFNEICL